MQEKIYKTQISDIRLEATLYESAFNLNKNSKDSMITQIKYLHQHSTYEVFLIIDGSLTITDEKSSTDYSNCAIIIPPLYNHYTISNLKKGYCMYLSINQAEAKQKNGTSLFDRVSSTTNGRISCFPLDDEAKFYATHIEKHLTDGSADEKVSYLIALLYSVLFEHTQKKCFFIFYKVIYIRIHLF